MSIFLFFTCFFNTFAGFDVELPKDSSVIIISKQDATLKIIKNSNNKNKVLSEFFISYGKKDGDKKLSGDKKTPVGVFFATDFVARQELKEMYGVGAIKLNYPNPIDVYMKKTGDNIWIHGTDNIERLSETNITNGCILIDNSKFDLLLRQIRISKTPIIIINNYSDIKISSSVDKNIKINVKEGKMQYKVFSDAKTQKMVYERVIK